MNKENYTIVPVANEGLHQKRYGQPYYRIIEGNLEDLFLEPKPVVRRESRLTTIFRRLRVRRRGKRK